MWNGGSEPRTVRDARPGCCESSGVEPGRSEVYDLYCAALVSGTRSLRYSAEPAEEGMVDRKTTLRASGLR